VLEPCGVTKLVPVIVTGVRRGTRKRAETGVLGAGEEGGNGKEQAWLWNTSKVTGLTITWPEVAPVGTGTVILGALQTSGRSYGSAKGGRCCCLWRAQVGAVMVKGVPDGPEGR